MKICKTRSELSDLLTEWRSKGLSVGAVPTMGSLHEGHLSLVDIAKCECDRTIATVFVNPLQFAPHEDFDEYPRDLDADVYKLQSRQCDAVFAPSSSELFPPDFTTKISVKGVGENHCALTRPHFFDGVATIVAKLLLLLRPDIAVFGEKDFQQLAVIRRMVRDLEIDVNIVGAPIIREPDGLAMSSRNQYLTLQERSVAPALFATISAAAKRLATTEESWPEIAQWAKNAIEQAGFSSVDYIHLVDAKSLEIIDAPGEEGRMLAAAHIGNTRLIDNIAASARR